MSAPPDGPAPLVVFGEDWGALPSSTQHLVSRLCADRDVVWVNSIGLRRPRLSRHDLRRALRKLATVLHPRGAGTGAAPAHSYSATRPARLSVVAPIALPFPGSRVAQALNGLLLGRQLRAVMRRRGLARPILWTSLPTALPVVGRLGERAVVYYCGDDFSALEGVDAAPVAALEARLAARADLVVTANAALAARFPAACTRVLPHGADIELFAKPQPRPADLPQGRVAGLYGSLAGWIDDELIADAARRLPDWHFVLIGPARAPLPALDGLPNVVRLGPRPHAQLPAYAQHWTASLLPFRDTPQIRAAEPLKLREYLAVGRPVLATPYGAAARLGGVVRLVGSGTELAVALCEATGDTPDAVVRRRAVVAPDSWAARADTLAGWLDGLGIPNRMADAARADRDAERDAARPGARARATQFATQPAPRG